ncbi:papain-like cysteine protease family protein [Nocardia sp. NPDC051570]|uniref:papain-like cysteine protease family protein n=1 Tax=Nocardia sp. NPDC051570 TaxID=3364324 RepID=UPI00379ABB65
MRPIRKMGVLLGIAVMIILSVGQGLSLAAPPADGKDFGGHSMGLRVTPGLPGVLEPRISAFGAKTLPYFQQIQQWNQWCWAADGASIATYLGHWIGQNDYCKLVFGVDSHGTCPNDTASLEEIAAAFGKIGFGASVGSPFSMTTVASEISANRPILTGIAWTEGGGHAQVVYGYDADAATITYGDPWPTSRRSVTQTLASYTENPDWIWFGEDYRITKQK